MSHPSLGALGITRLYALSQDGINSALDWKSTKTELTVVASSTDPTISITGKLKRAPGIEILIPNEANLSSVRVRLHLELFKQNSNIILPYVIQPCSCYKYKILISYSNNQTIELTTKWKIVLEGPLSVRLIDDLTLLPKGVYKTISPPLNYKDVDNAADKSYAISLDRDPSDVAIITAGTSTGIDPALDTYIEPFTSIMQEYWKGLACDQLFDLMYSSFPSKPSLQCSQWDNSGRTQWIPDQDYSNIPGGGNELLVFNSAIGRPVPNLRANWVTPLNNGALWIACQEFLVRNIQNAIYNLPQMLDERDEELNYDRHGDPNYPDNFPRAPWEVNTPFTGTLSINNTRPGSSINQYPIVETLQLTMSCQPPTCVQLVGNLSIQFIGLYKGDPTATYSPTSSLMFSTISDSGFLYITPLGTNEDGTYRTHLEDPIISPTGSDFGSINALYILYSGAAFIRYMAGVDGPAQDPTSPFYNEYLMNLFPICASLPVRP